MFDLVSVVTLSVLCALMSQPECYLVQCREQIMEEEVALTMFETDKYGSAIKQGQIVTEQVFSHCYTSSFVAAMLVLFFVLVLRDSSSLWVYSFSLSLFSKLGPCPCCGSSPYYYLVD